MDRNRQRFVAQRYPQLQGLRLLPLASVALIWAVYDAGLLPFLREADLRVARTWFWGGFAAAIIASFGIRRWYTSTYGWISQRPLYHSAAPQLLLAVCWFVIVGLWDPHGWAARIPLPLLFVTAATFGVALAHEPFRRHYFVIAALWLAASVVRAFGYPIGHVIFDLLIAMSLFMAGVGDHRLLSRTFQLVPARERIADHV